MHGSHLKQLSWGLGRSGGPLARPEKGGHVVGNRLDDKNEVWDEGYFTFDREMDQDNDNLLVEVLTAENGGKKVTILQIHANEEKDEICLR